MIHSQFSQRLQDFPPILCRLLARKKNGPPLTAKEIAERSAQTPNVKGSLNTVQVENISQCVNWEKIHILDALTFMCGCRVDLTEAKEFRRIKDYLTKEPCFEYLWRSPEWSNYHVPLIFKWRNSYEAEISHPVCPPVRKLLLRLNPILPAFDNRTIRRLAIRNDPFLRSLLRNLEPELVELIEPMQEENP